MSQAKPRNLVKEYYAEHFNFGGELRTRNEIIDDLKKQGGTPAMIDRYLQGLDLAKQIQARHPDEDIIPQPHLLPTFVGAFVPLILADWQRRGIAPTSWDFVQARDAWMAMISRGDGAELLFREPGKSGRSMALLLRVLAILAHQPGGVTVFGYHFEARGNG